MRMFRYVAIAILACVALSGCISREKVPAGNVGIQVDLYGSNKGVQNNIVLEPGYYWINTYNQEVFTFPTFTQNYVWARSHDGKGPDESITFQDKDGLAINADIGISYHIEHDKVPKVFQTYRRGIEEITDTFIRNMVRDSLVRRAGLLAMDEIYSTKKGKLLDDVQADVVAQVQPIGIDVDKIYWVGEQRLPDAVRNSLNMKIQATQNAERVQNEVAQTEAEAKKEIAKANGDAQAKLALATAEAKGIEIQGQALHNNPEVIRLRAIERWNGVLPVVQGSGSGQILNLQDVITPKDSK